MSGVNRRESGLPKKLCPGRIPAAKPKAEAGPGRTPTLSHTAMKMSNKLQIDQAAQDSLTGCLSRDRIAKYLRATQGNLQSALALYNWNTAVSAAFYGPLQWLEVTLRNSFDKCLVEEYGHEWYLQEGVGLDSLAIQKVNAAKGQIVTKGHTVTHSRMIAELPFGFWTSLLGPGGMLPATEEELAEGEDPPTRKKANYEMTLWRPALRKSFPYRKRLPKKEARESLDYMRTLRNRVAHHEPIFQRDLHADHAQILRVTGWTSPAARAWIEEYSRVPDLLDSPRDARVKF